eukprot:gene11424-13316_t
MFWGIEVGKEPVPFVPAFDAHLTMACLTVAAKGSERNVLVIKYDDQELSLCSLRVNGQEHSNLDIMLEEGKEVVFQVAGAGAKVSLTGYFVSSMDQQGEDEEDDEDEEEEDSEEDVEMDDETAAQVQEMLNKRKAADAPAAAQQKKAKAAPAVATPEASPKKAAAASPVAKPVAAAPAAKKESNSTITKHANGLIIEELSLGNGPEAVKGKKIFVKYIGKLTNGKTFDKSLVKPFDFKLGMGQVIKGWDLGFAGMKVGGRRRLTIPAKLGYGQQGAAPDIPGGATLVFDVELCRDCSILKAFLDAMLCGRKQSIHDSKHRCSLGGQYGCTLRRYISHSKHYSVGPPNQFRMVGGTKVFDVLHNGKSITPDGRWRLSTYVKIIRKFLFLDKELIFLVVKGSTHIISQAIYSMQSLEEMNFKQVDRIRFLLGLDRVVSQQDEESGQCTVTYALPVLLIQKIIRMLWRTLWMDYNHRDTAYSSLLELCLVSKEMFHFVSTTLFTSLRVNWVRNVKDGAASEYFKAFLNPYSPYKRVVRTNDRPITNDNCTPVPEWFHFGMHVRRLEIRFYSTWRDYTNLLCPLEHLTLRMEDTDYLGLVNNMTNLKTFAVTQTIKSCAPSFVKYLYAQDTLTSLSLINVTIDVDELSRILANKPAITKLVLHSPKMPVIPSTLQTLFVNYENSWLLNDINNNNKFMVTYLRMMKESGQWSQDLPYLIKLTSLRKFRLSVPIKRKDTDHLFSQILQSPNIQRIIFDLDNSDYRITPPDITPQSIEEWSNCSAYGLSIIRLTLSRNCFLKVTFAKTTATDQVSNQLNNQLE